MRDWPEVTEPLLRERQGMSAEEFFEELPGRIGRVRVRALDGDAGGRAVLAESPAEWS
jgi:hypothetical protein